MMIIACPNCDSKFKLPANAIGTEGRFVRCGDCTHEWLAHLEETTPLTLDTNNDTSGKHYQKEAEHSNSAPIIGDTSTGAPHSDYTVIKNLNMDTVHKESNATSHIASLPPSARHRKPFFAFLFTTFIWMLLLVLFYLGILYYNSSLDNFHSPVIQRFRHVLNFFRHGDIKLPPLVSMPSSAFSDLVSMDDYKADLRFNNIIL